MLPTASPIGWVNFNYTVVAVIVVLGFAGIYWLVSAKNWFKGPKVQGTAEELAAIERELSVLMPAETGRPRRGLLTLEELRSAVGAGEIDTVVLAFTDMQGRLQGKRLSAEFFLEEVAEHYSEGCNYLLAVDVDMNTVDGYDMSSWERGYGNFVMVPDMATLRRLPWHQGSALVIADLTWHDGAPVMASPRQILAAQIERLASRGWVALAGTELEFIVYQDSYEQAAAKDYRDLVPANQYNVDYSILGTSRIEPLLRRIRLDMAGAGPVRGVGQGRVQPRPARDRVPLRGGGDHLRQPLDLQDRGEGDRGPGREQHHVHGQAERPRGKLLPHPPVAALCF